MTGWQVFNHKGLVVEQFQPVFATSDAYSAGDDTTPSVKTTYDPLGRPERVDFPDGTFETTTYDPWVRSLSDRNDNAGHLTGSDPRYGSFLTWFSTHLDTPTRTFVDALGREVAVEEHNGGTNLHVTRSVLDMADRVTEVWDARGLSSATWEFTYDYAGRRIQTAHSTALGTRYALSDAAGSPIWSRDARGIEVDRTFDVLNRPLEEQTDDGTTVKRRRLWTYLDYVPAHPDFASNQSKNLYGQVEEARDADGLRFFEYEHRGLLSKVSHRFWDVAWKTATDPVWTDGASWDPEVTATARDSISTWLTLDHLADTTTVEVATTYDSAGRPTEVTSGRCQSFMISFPHAQTSPPRPPRSSPPRDESWSSPRSGVQDGWRLGALPGAAG